MLTTATSVTGVFVVHAGASVTPGTGSPVSPGAGVSVTPGTGSSVVPGTGVSVTSGAGVSVISGSCASGFGFLPNLSILTILENFPYVI